MVGGDGQNRPAFQDQILAPLEGGDFLTFDIELHIVDGHVLQAVVEANHLDDAVTV